MTAIDDALQQLRRHRGLSRVEDPVEVGGTTRITVEVPVELPSRARSAGVSATGVRALERCVLVFTGWWPFSAPRPYLREDFPLGLPHINPHRAGRLVSPCVFEGSLDELLHRFGLDAIIDQVIDWLSKAAAGTLIDLAQGWEPTRRDACPSTVVFDADQVAAATPTDGTVLTVACKYATFSDGIYARVSSGLQPAQDLVFDQVSQAGTENALAFGNCAGFIVRAPFVQDEPPVLGDYRPESVVDLPSLLENAQALGINREALERVLADYFAKSVLGSGHDFRNWLRGLFAIVVLVAQRPAPLVNSPGRSVEALPYVVHYDTANASSDMLPPVTVHPAFHAHQLSASLLAQASSVPALNLQKKLVILGCGSLGSKVGLHLGRCGFGNITFVDNEALAPHNFARHALLDEPATAISPGKAERMQMAFAKLSHADARAIDANVMSVLSDAASFANVVSDDVSLVLDLTASLQVQAVAAASGPLSNHSARFVRASLYGQGRCAVLMLEAPQRTVRVDDLTALLFEYCRSEPTVRRAIAGDLEDPARIFVGDNCRSFTTPMSDAVISRSAAPIAIQVERWLTDGAPDAARMSVGVTDELGLGMKWTEVATGPVTIVDAADDGGWEIRILSSVANAIDADARQFSEVETGGALIGRVSYECRAITIAGLVDAPPDTTRDRDRFVLGTEGLISALRQANSDSLGYLMFVGTWHSHPLGGQHSGIDRKTLSYIAKEAGGLPVVSLIWTPSGFRCEVARW